MEIKDFLNNGVAIAILAWMLYKLEPRLKSIAEAINRQSQLFMVLLDEMDQSRATPRSKAQQEVLQTMRADLLKEQGGRAV
ncbi:MAG TPA: hypothetical protein VF762_14325 [Blastocatellia bacterium]|jgi:hypothetical protein